MRISDFFCTQCGHQTFPVVRTPRHAREPGHLKKLYCPYCHVQTNQCEIKDYGKYTKEDFFLEFQYGNFDKEGCRIDPSWKHFTALIKQKLAQEEKVNENV